MRAILTTLLALVISSAAFAQGGNPQYPEQAGSKAGGGLFMSAPPGLMQPSQWMVYCNDFITASDFDVTNDWTLTEIDLATGGGATGALVDGAGDALGLLLLSPEAAANTGAQIQLDTPPGGTGALVLAAAGRTIIFEARLKIATPQLQDFFIGLANTVTVAGTSGVLDGNGVWEGAITDAAAFYANEADVGIVQASYEDPTAAAKVEVGSVNGGVALSNATYYRFGIRLVGTSYAEWYLNGARQRSVTFVNPLTSAMTPTITNVGDVVAESMTVDYVCVAQSR